MAFFSSNPRRLGGKRNDCKVLARPCQRSRTQAGSRTMSRVSQAPRVILGALLGLFAADSAFADTSESPLDSAERLAARGAASFTDGALSERLRAIRGAPFGSNPEVALPTLVGV